MHSDLTAVSICSSTPVALPQTFELTLGGEYNVIGMFMEWGSEGGPSEFQVAVYDGKQWQEVPPVCRLPLSASLLPLESLSDIACATLSCLSLASPLRSCLSNHYLTSLALLSASQLPLICCFEGNCEDWSAQPCNGTSRVARVGPKPGCASSPTEHHRLACCDHQCPFTPPDG